MPIINTFQGQYRFLSNFYPTNVRYEDIIYPSSEHAYQAAKTLDKKERHLIAMLPTAGKAKRAGKLITLREDWENIKLHVMYLIVKEKFTSNYLLRMHLSKTKQLTLIEGNNWHDNFWGICYCARCTNIVGQNNLGQILMRVREELM